MKVRNGICAALVAVVMGCVAGALVSPAQAEEVAQEVESTLVKSVGYDAATQVLTVVLVNTGETYEYAKVPEEVYKEFMAAESKGQFFVKNIKGKYEFVKKD